MWSALGSEPLNATAQWEGEGGGRGTWTILSTCIVTLILCVWTAVHMNIPREGHGSAQTFAKARWMLMALFAPEVVVYTAFQQRRAAMRLHRTIATLLDPLTRPSRFNQQLGGKMSDEAREESPLKPKSYRAHPWTKTHSAFAVMGGFAFDNSANADEVPLPGERTRLVLPPAGLLFLAKHHPELIPDISEEAIKDKSKADGLAKVITCVQAAYFLAQTISRLGYGLPVTLLELNTVAHSLCALSTYVLWWYKPFDVKEPATIPTYSTAASICAAMCMRSSVGYLKDVHYPGQAKGMWGTAYFAVLEFNFDVGKAVDSEAAVVIAPPTESGQADAIDRLEADSTYEKEEKNPPTREDRPRQPLMTDHDETTAAVSKEGSFEMKLHQEEHGLVMRFTCDNTNMPIEPLRSFFNTFDKRGFSRRPDALVMITPDTLKLCNLARHVIPQYPELKDPLIRYREYGRDNTIIEMSRGPWSDLVCDKVDDFPRPAVTGVKIWDYLVSCVGIALANLLYAGLHLLAWNGPFRSRPEEILWRLSAITLCLPLGVILLALVLVPISGALIKLVNPKFRTNRGKQFSLKTTLFETDGPSSWDDNMEIIDNTFDVLFGRFDRGMFQPRNILVGIPMVIFGLPCVVLYVASLLSLFYSGVYSLVIGRPYVVVEGFLSLPYSPPGVYLTPDWSSYWPHFS